MKRIVAVVAVSLGLVACGPGAKVGGGKQGAAEAFAAASSASKAGADKSATPLDLTGSVTWNCPEGGQASLDSFHLNVNVTGGTNVDQSFNITYKNCGGAKSDVGVAVYNGTFAVSQKVAASSGSADISQSFKGKVSVQGAFDDFIDVDVTQKVSASALGGTGSVSMNLVGSISDTSGTYTFNEDVSVSAGKVTVDTSKK